MLEVSNDALGLTCDPGAGRIAIHDRHRKVTWTLDEATRILTPDPHGQPSRLTSASSTRVDDQSIRQEFDVVGGRVSYVWQLLDDGVLVTLETNHEPGAWQFISLPGSFTAEGLPMRLALPVMQGLLYDGRGEPFEQVLHQGGHAGFSMAMAGYLTNRGGLLLVIDDYADWRAVVGKRDGGELYVYANAQASLGALRYPRHARLLLTDPSVTALCKRYRRRVQERGDWKPWAEKVAERPAVERLFGGLMTFIGYNASNIDYVAWCRKLRDLGFDRAFVYPVRFNHYSQDFQMGGDAPIHLDDRTIHAIKDIGYDVSSWMWVYEALDDGSEERQRAYLRNAAGDIVPNWKIDDYHWYVCCSSTQPDFVRVTYRGDMRDMTWAHYDVSATCGFAECYALDHPRHRGHAMDRRTDMTFLRELLGPATNGNRPVSSEGFNDALATAYDIGTTKLLPAFGDAPFWTAPMTMLVYHDSMIHDWWEVHNYNAHANFDNVLRFGRKVDGFPYEKAAMDALYGCPPNVFPFGRQYQWVDFAARTTRSFVVHFDDSAVQEALAAALPVTRLHRRIGPLELLSHEYLTEDGGVQATTFADGTRVIANFTSAACHVDEVGEMKAKSWIAT